MHRIKLIVTGDLEKLALHESLKRFFPCKMNNKDVIWEEPRKLNCTTTSCLRSLEKNKIKPSDPMKALARAMLRESFEAKSQKNSKPPDLVIVIDDVEIGNLDRENIVAEHFRAAVEYVFKEKQYNREELRKKCSFHLLRPMVESYFFGDADALRNAGVSDTEKPQLIHKTDVEQFETNDPKWLPTCKMENDKRKKIISWWHHERHPKHYLEHLTERSGIFYDESNFGKKALEKLAWKKVPKIQSDTPFIRSLFEDIAEWFDIPNPLGTGGATSPYFYPDKSVNRTTLLLRNM